MADVVEKAFDIGIQNPVHLLHHDCRRKSVECVVRTSPWTKSG
jgi:hypothetical protein